MTRAIRVVDVRANDASPYNETLLTIGATDEPTPMLEAARGDAGALAAAHVRWDPAGTKNLETWFKAAEERPEFGELLAARIAVAPDELVPRLYELEQGPRVDVCARDRKLASEKPSSPTWQYLASRCIDDRAARNEAFVTLAARWPDDPWLMYMHGAVLADRGAFDDAEKLLAHAAPRLPETSSRVMTLRARIARVTGSQLYDTLVDHDPLLTRLRDFERGNVDVRGNLLVYRLLDRGDLPAPKASFERGLTPMLFLLVACDDRATHVQINAGAVPPSKVSVDHAIYAYALALRTGRDPGPYRTLVTDAAPDLRQAFAFVDAVHAAAPGTLDQIPPPVGFIERAMAYAAATVRLGDATPPQWRTFAARALSAFVYERPSFRE